MGLAHFSIGTATDRIDLLRNVRVADWEPSETPIEDTFASSALAEGRQLASHRYLNAVESIEFHVIAATQDQVVRWSQDLRRMLRRAREYWDTEHQPDIVYLQAQASCETNVRYAWVHRGDVPRDNNPYGQPFQGRNAPRFWERQMIVERSAWLADAPGSGTVVAVEGSAIACFPSFLEFDGVDDEVDCGSDAVLDDLPTGAFTVEAWIRPDTWGGSTGIGSAIVTKTVSANIGWYLKITNTGGLIGFIYCAGVNAFSSSGLDEFGVGTGWQYVMMCYDVSGAGTPAARTIYLNIGGVWVATYLTQTASTLAYSSAAAQNLYIGWEELTGTEGFDGGIGWVRVSDSIRYDPADPDFSPPPECELPVVDANTQGQWIYEGVGVTTANQGAGATAGTIFEAVWDCDCPRVVGYVPPPVLPPGVGTYLLRATFDAPNVGYVNMQVLDTEPEMGTDFAGQLTVTEASGTMGIVSNECSADNAGGISWLTHGFYSQVIARAFGRTLLFDMADTVAVRLMELGWSDTAVVDEPTNGYVVVRAAGNTMALMLYVGGAAQLQLLFGAWALATDYKFALVLGGYDVNGVPWRSGQAKASYLYGVACYFQGGAWGTDWHLFFKLRSLNTAMLYAMFANFNATATTDDVRIPDEDLSDAYVINNYSTFDAINGTSLDAITPEIGGVWTENDGNWDIQGNEANLAGLGAAEENATVDSGLSDCVIEATVTAPAGINSVGVIFRYEGVGPSYWWVQLFHSGNIIYLYEVNGGSTPRGSFATVLNSGTPYHICISLDGQRIDIAINDNWAIQYAAAAMNETETKHGIIASVVNCTVDNFVIYPKTSTTYDTVLDAV